MQVIAISVSMNWLKSKAIDYMRSRMQGWELRQKAWNRVIFSKLEAVLNSMLKTQRFPHQERRKGLKDSDYRYHDLKFKIIMYIHQQASNMTFILFG